MPNYKVVNADQLDADLKIVADAIRAKPDVGNKELSFPNGMKSAIESIPQPGGLIRITENGLHSVYDYSLASIEVPNTIPDGYIQPSGELEITSNGNYDVTEYSSVSVSVPTVGGGDSGGGDSGGGDSGDSAKTIKAGTYQLQSGCCYGFNGNGIEEWSEQYISATVTIDGTYISNASIERMEVHSDDRYTIHFYDITHTEVGYINPGFTLPYNTIVAKGEEGYNSFVIAKDQAVPASFKTWWDAYTKRVEVQEDSGESVTISAGTYKLTDYTCAEYESGIFDWEAQSVSGRVTSDGDSVTNEPFNSISNDGAYCVYFDGTYAYLNPSYVGSDSLCEVTFDTDQAVDKNFKRWWDYCFTKVEDSGETTVTCEVCGGTVPEDSAYYPNFCGDSCYEEYKSNEDSGSGGTTIPAGTYRLNSIYDVYDEIVSNDWTEQDIVGELHVYALEGEEDYRQPFKKMVITQYEGFQDLALRNSDSEYTTLNPGFYPEGGTYDFEITLYEAPTMSAGFKTWWDKHTSIVS